MATKFPRLNDYFDTVTSLDKRWIDSPLRKCYAVIVVLMIVMWQMLYWAADTKQDKSVGRADASGFNHYRGKEFVYYYYHLGLFPLATVTAEKQDSLLFAQGQLVNNLGSLRMEIDHWARLGESARIWLYMPHCWLKKSTKDTSLRFFNGIFFNITLIFLFLGFYSIRRPVLGIFTVLLVGSSPFLLYEVYQNENIFGLMVSNALLLLGLHMPLFKGNISWPKMMVPIASGILLGLMYNVRVEGIPIILSCIVIYLVNADWKWLSKLLMIGLLLISFQLTKKQVIGYFSFKKAVTHALLTKYGGHPFNGEETEVHPFWHSLYAGLGDFDKKYGYVWDDAPAYRYALPILREKNKLPYNYPGRTELSMNEYYDEDSLYYKKPETLPGYDEVIKEKVIGDIKNDPVWFMNIIINRLDAILSHTSPICLQVFRYQLRLPFWGYLLLPLLALFIVRRQWSEVKLLLFTLPLAASSLLIYSGRNNTYSSVFHFISAAILLVFILNLCMKLFHKLKNRQRVPEQ